MNRSISINNIDFRRTSGSLNHDEVRVTWRLHLREINYFDQYRYHNQYRFRLIIVKKYRYPFYQYRSITTKLMGKIKTLIFLFRKKILFSSLTHMIYYLVLAYAYYIILILY